MKLTLKIGCILALFTAGIVACSEESDEVKYYTTDTSGPTPELEGFNQLTVIKPNGVTLSNDNEFLITWETGDKISVYESDGEWVADMKIQDAATTVSIFAVEGDVRLDDDTKYIAVFPARSSEELVSYEDYVTATKDMSTEQTQVADSFDHLKDESYMEVSFRGDDPITFVNQKTFITILFDLEDTAIPTTLKFNCDNTDNYTLNLTTLAKSSTSISYQAYMMINPLEETTQERSFSFTVLAENGDELINKEIKTSSQLSSATLYSINLNEGTITEGESSGSTSGSGSAGSNEDLELEDGEWL